MKRQLVMILLAALLLALVACTNDPSPTEQTECQQTTEVTLPETAPAGGLSTNSDGSINLPVIPLG